MNARMSRNGPLWFRLPRILTSLGPSLVAASLMIVVAATPMILWLLLPHESLVDWLTQQAWDILAGDPYVQALDPQRQTAIPERIADALWATYPKFAGVGLAAGTVAAAAYILVARLLRPVFSATPEPTLPTSSLVRSLCHQWIAPLLLSLLGLVAHVPYIEKSLNLDEAYVLQRMMANGWFWADTRWGWWVHVGGLLLVQLSALLFGYGAWAVRLPAALLSSAALGVLYAWVRSLHGSRVALLTAGLLALWPTWAEQCATARGYGLSVACGILALVSLWRLLEEDRPHLLSLGTSVWLLFFAVLFGCLAHFFWFFFGLACLLLLFWRAYFARKAAAAAAAFLTGIAMTLAGFVYAPGLPAMLFRTTQVGRLDISEMALQMIQAFGFRAQWPVSLVITCVAVGLGAGGLFLVGRSERRFIVLILLVSVGLVLCFQPVHLVPRFFLHLCFLWYLAMLPLGLLLDRLFQPRLALATVTVLLAASVSLVQPWAQLPMVDLRSLAAYCRDLDAAGESCLLDASLHGAAIYPLGSHTPFGNLNRGIPVTARRLARCHPVLHPPLPPPKGFQQVKVFPGWESNILVFERLDASKNP
jgi:hypothetical protein